MVCVLILNNSLIKKTDTLSDSLITVGKLYSEKKKKREGKKTGSARVKLGENGGSST